MEDTDPLSAAEYEYLYSRVPRLTVDLVLLNGSGAVFLAKRAIQPCQGLWHLPGGTVRYAEPLIDAVRRVARREIGIDVGAAKGNGFIEYPSHYLNGLGSPVGIVFEVTSFTGDVQVNLEAEDGRWFSHVPAGMHADQDAYLIEGGYLTP